VAEFREFGADFGDTIALMGWRLFTCAWIIILAWYLANAFQRIAQLEKRMEELEERKK
jgi:hypothetical protein